MTDGVSVPERPFETDDNGGERKTAPAGNRGLTSAGPSRQEADVDIIVPQSNRSRQAHPVGSVEHLRELLADSIRLRGQLVALIGRHWFVAGDGGYCQACGLPEINRQHAERAA
jgi:hypothetical protein